MQIDEQHRHRCEVRMLLRLRGQRGREEAREWIEELAKRRGGQEAVEKLRADCTAQWQAGNRGEFGDWREAAEAKA